MYTGANCGAITSDKVATYDYWPLTRDEREHYLLQLFVRHVWHEQERRPTSRLRHATPSHGVKCGAEGTGDVLVSAAISQVTCLACQLAEEKKK